MGAPRLKCNLCEQPLAGHCPDSNPTCTWLRCRNADCTADVYDWHRGTLRHADGRVEGWDEQPTSDQPPTIDITDDSADDGRPATPDA
jgi:hypothetical protein